MAQPLLRSRPPPSSRPARRWPRLRFGKLWVDSVTFDQALATIAELIDRGEGGSVFTPNVDHVITAEDHEGFRAAYRRASLCLADGQPLVWASNAAGLPLPAKISGSDLVWPLLQQAAKRRDRVYLLGGDEGVAAAVARRIEVELGGIVCGHDSPRILLEPSHLDGPIVERIRAARPQLILVALGAPKQELWSDRTRELVAPAVQVGIGASLDFLAGKVSRAPRWMSAAGLEWAYRLAQEPGRLWRRYLVKDRRFAKVLARTLAEPSYTRLEMP